MIIEHPNWRAGYEDGIAPNCLKCLHAMDPRDDHWYCADCKTTEEPGQRRR